MVNSLDWKSWAGRRVTCLAHRSRALPQAKGVAGLNIWDERKLSKSLQMSVKELGLFRDEAARLSDTLCAVDEDGDRADAQRERGESWAEVVEALDAAREALSDALATVEPLLARPGGLPGKRNGTSRATAVQSVDIGERQSEIL